MSEEPPKPRPVRVPQPASYIDVNRACTAWLARRGLLFRFDGSIAADIAEAQAKKKSANAK